MGLHRARYDTGSAHELLVDTVLAVADIGGATTDGVEPAYHSIDGDVFEAFARERERRTLGRAAEVLGRSLSGDRRRGRSHVRAS